MSKRKLKSASRLQAYLANESMTASKTTTAANNKDKFQSLARAGKVRRAKKGG